LGEIRKAAAEQTEHKVPLDAIYGAWLRPAIALAAMLVAIMGIGVVNHYQAPGEFRVAKAVHAGWNDNFDSELNSLSTMLAANFDSTPDASSLDANSLAREILMLDGSNQ
jgi:hypothetical protein